MAGRSIINIMARSGAMVANYQFDASLEEELTMSVEIPTYPVESGAEIADHRIVNPCKYRIKGVVSNTPLTVSVFDFAGGLVSNLSSNPAVAAVAGMSAGYLSGYMNGTDSHETRASAALAQLVQLLEGEKPFDVAAGDITLKNMLVTRISRTRTPETENGLVFDLELSEFVTVERLNSDGQPSHEQLAPDSQKKGLAGLKSRGEVMLEAVTDKVKAAVKEVKDVAKAAADKLSTAASSAASAVSEV